MKVAAAWTGMGKDRFVEELSDGDAVASQFSVKYKKPVKEYKNGYFFVLGLADRTGEIELKYWGGGDEDRVRRVYDGIEEDTVIAVRGEVSIYQDKEQIDVEEDEGAIKNVDDYDAADFVPETDKDIDAMERRLRETVAAMDDDDYRAVMEAFLDDDAFMAAFRRAPAAMYYHHAYIGGLLEHVLAMLAIADTLTDRYPTLDENLVTAGCVLHDIGKVHEFDVTTNITQSEAGLLRGHISLGEQLLREKLDAVDIPDRKANKLHHIVLAHHGEDHQASQVTPSFPEAAAVHFADETDAQLYQYVDLTEDAETDDFHTYTDRFGQLYLR